jgi:hypothetical protein
VKPITYWVQNGIIDQLIDSYGATLEKLRPESRRELIAYLANADNCWVRERVSDADDAYRIARALRRHDQDLLIQAIAATLTHHDEQEIAAK